MDWRKSLGLHLVRDFVPNEAGQYRRAINGSARGSDTRRPAANTPQGPEGSERPYSEPASEAAHLAPATVAGHAACA